MEKLKQKTNKKKWGKQPLQGEKIFLNYFNIFRELRYYTHEQNYSFKLKTKGSKNKRVLRNLKI